MSDIPSYMHGVRERVGDKEITMDESIRMEAASRLQNKKRDEEEAERDKKLQDFKDRYEAWEGRNPNISAALKTFDEVMIPHTMPELAMMMAAGPVLKGAAKGIGWAGNKALTGARNLMAKKVGADKADEAMNALREVVSDIGNYEIPLPTPQMRKGMAVIPFKGSGKPRVVPEESAKVLTRPEHVGDDVLEILSNNPRGVAEAITKEELKAITPMLKRYRSRQHTEELNKVAEEYHVLEANITRMEEALKAPLEASTQARYKEVLPLLKKEHDALGMTYLHLTSNKPRGKLTTDAVEDIVRGLSSNIRDAASAHTRSDNALTATQKAAQKIVDRSNKYNPQRPPKPASTDVEEALTILSNIARRAKPGKPIEMDLTKLIPPGSGLE